MARVQSDNLDDLIASLNSSGNGRASSNSVLTPSKPVPQRAVAAATMSDLDALLTDLDSGRSSTVSSPGRAAPSYGNQSSYQSQPSNYGASSNYQSQPSSYNPSTSNSFVNSRPPPQASNPATVPVRKTPLAGDDLDNVLTGLLSSNQNIDGPGPAARGSCAQCRKPILGEVIQALGKTFHPEHFRCGHCQDPLGTANFHEEGGVPHCEKCFVNVFSSRCAHCNEPIGERALVAQGKKWHAGHFVCTQCLKTLEGGSYLERDGRAYCENCFHNTFNPRCAGCGQVITGEVTNALGQQWHPSHFVCHTCQKPFTGNFYEYVGKPYCETHYHQHSGSLCGGCNKAITGRSVNACNQKWHPEHLVCAYCTKQIGGASFAENNNRPYCNECHSKLFG